ncbi:hypothetical protein DCAR_0935859 [Daucus carota subsp. sativus]|uniref:Uncharacterized protein n=1 Tax=Daucus carota subsp. sativus TaxID=79200 RepID=A0AAF0XY07_DAUCS|nr:hypothetical protein DCAR_0935859 [Daucus carota subsp. sativus]
MILKAVQNIGLNHWMHTYPVIQKSFEFWPPYFYMTVLGICFLYLLNHLVNLLGPKFFILD